MRERGGLRKSWELGALLLIMLLAAVLRFYRLPNLPPGLHFDEGFQGVTARTLLQGGPPQIFFESDMGEEPIALYLVAAALRLFGYEPWIIRLTSAVIGVLTIPLAWWLARGVVSLSGSRDSATPQEEAVRRRIVGLGTALVLAILYWHVSFSRIGMEPILVPLFATLALAALLAGLNSRRSYLFALAGLALGGSLYTYKAGYFVPVVAVVFVAYAALVERGFLRRHGRGLLLAALVALLVAAPIGIYFATHPANFLQRPASVALVGGEHVSSPWRAVLENVPRVLGMFFWRGDDNPRSNLPGRPALDPFLALLFFLGLARAFAGVRRPAWALPLLWLGVMSLPTVVTEHAPHFGRAIGGIPAVALLCALGGWTLWRGVARLGSSGLRWAGGLLLVAGLLFSGLSTGWAYFHTWASSPTLFYAYDVGLTRVAQYANALPTDQDVYLTPTSCDHYTLQFLLRRPCASFDGRVGQVFPPPDRAATVVVLLREDGATLPTLRKERPDGEVAWTLVDSYGNPYAAAYYLLASQSPAPLPTHPMDARFGGAIRLLGYATDVDAVAPGEPFTLVLYWQALAPLVEDYTVFTHLVGPSGAAGGAVLWAGHDGQPDGGHYPTRGWQPGETILDKHTLSVPEEAPLGDYRLEVGLYLLATLQRLPAVDGDGLPLPGDAAVLGNVKVRGPGSE